MRTIGQARPIHSSSKTPRVCRSSTRPMTISTTAPTGVLVHELRWPAARYMAAFPEPTSRWWRGRHGIGRRVDRGLGERILAQDAGSDFGRLGVSGRRAPGRGSEAAYEGRRRRGHPQPDPQVIQTEGIGQRQSVAPRLGRLRGVKDLVKDPGRDQQTKNTLLSERLTNTAKMSTWASAFTNCPLYMAPTPGIKPKRPARTGCACMPVKPGGAGSRGQARRQAGLAVDAAPDRTRAGGTQRLATTLTISGSHNIGMVKAVHTKLLCATPDFLRNSVALANLMRLSLTKAAHVVMFSAAGQAIRVWSSVGVRQGPENLFLEFPSSLTVPAGGHHRRRQHRVASSGAGTSLGQGRDLLPCGDGRAGTASAIARRRLGRFPGRRERVRPRSSASIPAPGIPSRRPGENSRNTWSPVRWWSSTAG